MAGGENVQKDVHVRRDGQGNVVSVSLQPAEGHEPCAADKPEVQNFLQAVAPSRKALEASDLSLIRALEDLIDALIRKDVLRLTDLPDSVQAKLMSRRRLRGSLRSLSLLDGEQDTL